MASLCLGGGRAFVPTEWAVWPPDRTLVPPPPQPGQAQPSQEVPRSQVGEVGAGEAGRPSSVVSCWEERAVVCRIDEGTLRGGLGAVGSC